MVRRGPPHTRSARCGTLRRSYAAKVAQLGHPGARPRLITKCAHGPWHRETDIADWPRSDKHRRIHASGPARVSTRTRHVTATRQATQPETTRAPTKGPRLCKPQRPPVGRPLRPRQRQQPRGSSLHGAQGPRLAHRPWTKRPKTSRPPRRPRPLQPGRQPTEGGRNDRGRGHPARRPDHNPPKSGGQLDPACHLGDIKVQGPGEGMCAATVWRIAGYSRLEGAA